MVGRQIRIGSRRVLIISGVGESQWLLREARDVWHLCLTTWGWSLGAPACFPSKPADRADQGLGWTDHSFQQAWRHSCSLHHWPQAGGTLVLIMTGQQDSEQELLSVWRHPLNWTYVLFLHYSHMCQALVPKKGCECPCPWDWAKSDLTFFIQVSLISTEWGSFLYRYHLWARAR